MITILYLFLVTGCHKGNTKNNGQETYDIYCSLCHGVQGEGYLAPQANALGNPEFLSAATDDFIEYELENEWMNGLIEDMAKQRDGTFKTKPEKQINNLFEASADSGS